MLKNCGNALKNLANRCNNIQNKFFSTTQENANPWVYECFPEGISLLLRNGNKEMHISTLYFKDAYKCNARTTNQGPENPDFFFDVYDGTFSEEESGIEFELPFTLFCDPFCGPANYEEAKDSLFDFFKFKKETGLVNYEAIIESATCIENEIFPIFEDLEAEKKTFDLEEASKRFLYLNEEFVQYFIKEENEFLSLKEWIDKQKKKEKYGRYGRYLW